MTADDVVIQLGALVEGYREALARFRAVAYDDEIAAERAYISLFETLNWASTISWRLGEPNRPDLLRAIEYARNAAHHEWLHALELTLRRYGEGVYGEGKYGGHIWRWRRSEDLPLDRPDPRREPLYRGLLADRPAISTLMELEEEFGTI